MPKSSGASKTTAKNPKPRGNGKKNKGVFFTLLMVLVVFIIIVAIFGGVFYIIIHNNINGLAESYRSTIQNIPLAKLALPAAPDPLDPKYMTEDEIKEKYLEFREENEALKKQLSEANISLNELQEYKDESENMKQDTDNKLQEVKNREVALNEKELQLKEYKKVIDELTVNGDKDSFKEYYEKLDSENAKLLYEEIVKEEQTDADTKKFAQVYAAMDASAAAQIFEQLGSSKMDLIAATLKAMSKENSAAILESMTPVFAAKVTEKLDALYKGN